MNTPDDTILAQAAAWHAASESDAMDWDGFTAWLEADPRHAAAYDEVALADSLLADHRDTLADAEPAEDEPVVIRPAPSAWKRWAGVAIAASLVGLLVVPTFISGSPEIYETGRAAQTIALDDGSSVILAPHSKLTVEGKRQEQIALSGGAWFDIAHKPDRPLTITAGGTRISDIGTRFDVQDAGGQVRVEVAEGKVEVAADALSAPIRLAAGKGLLFDAKAGTAVVSPVSNEDAGEWRSGHLTYDSTPLALVAADLGRYAGVSVDMPASLRNRRFSGTLVVSNGEAAVRDLAQVMELSLTGDGSGYRLGERNR